MDAGTGVSIGAAGTRPNRLRERQRKRAKERRHERRRQRARSSSGGSIYSVDSVEGAIAAIEQQTIVIGHRGAAAYCAHNSLASFSRAIELGVDMIELDVRVTNDGALAVFHDHLTEHGKGSRVDGMTMAELQRAHPSTRTFEEVMEHIHRCCVKAGTETKVYVDLKGRAVVKPVLACLSAFVKRRKWNAAERLTMCSFNQFDIAEVTRALDADAAHPLHGVTLGVLLCGVPLSLSADARALGAKLVVTDAATLFTEAGEALVRDCRGHGIRVMVYTVNSREDMRLALELGLAGICTDYIDVCRAERKSHAEATVARAARSHAVAGGCGAKTERLAQAVAAAQDARRREEEAKSQALAKAAGKAGASALRKAAGLARGNPRNPSGSDRLVDPASAFRAIVC